MRGSCLWVGVCAVSMVTAVEDGRAAIVERDYESFGDKLLLYDTLSGREWLDLSVPVGLSVKEFQTIVNGGGNINGFHVASTDDVLELLLSAGFNEDGLLWGEQSFSIGFDLMNKLSGTALDITREEWYLDGYVGPAYSLSQSTRIELKAWSTPTQEGARATSFSEIGGIDGDPRFLENMRLFGSVWRFREAAAPEPSTVVMALVNLALLGGLAGSRWRVG